VKLGFTVSAWEFQNQRSYKLASESENPFYCMACLQTHYRNEISQLKEQLILLSSKITSLTEDTSTQSQSATIFISETSSVSSNTNVQPSSATSHNNAPSHTHKVVSTESTTARKFNIVLSGLPECRQGTKKV